MPSGVLSAALLIFAGNELGLFGEKETAPPTENTQEIVQTQPPYSVSSVVMSSPSISLTEGTTKELRASCIPEPPTADETPELIWKSSDTSVATVDPDGIVTGISAGIVTVYVEDDMEVYDECTVTVEAAMVTSLSIEQEPNKTEYRFGEELDTEGLVLRAEYNNDSIERITDLSGCEFEYDLNGLGTRTVRVTYKGATAEFTVKISLF